MRQALALGLKSIVAPRDVVSTGRIGLLQGCTLFLAAAVIAAGPAIVAISPGELGILAEAMGPVLLVLGLGVLLIVCAGVLALFVSYNSLFFWAAFRLASRRATFSGIFRAGVLVTFGVSVLGFVPDLVLSFVEAAVPGAGGPIASLIEQALWLVGAIYLVKMLSELSGLGVVASFYVCLAASFAALIGYLGISWLVGSVLPDLDLLLESTDELE